MYNKDPGGKQPKMQDTVWNGQPQTMSLPDGRPKGAALVLEERGYDTKRMKLEDMGVIVVDHEDFKNENVVFKDFLAASATHVFLSPNFTVSLTQLSMCDPRASVTQGPTATIPLAPFAEAFPRG